MLLSVLDVLGGRFPAVIRKIARTLRTASFAVNSCLGRKDLGLAQEPVREDFNLIIQTDARGARAARVARAPSWLFIGSFGRRLRGALGPTAHTLAALRVEDCDNVVVRL